MKAGILMTAIILVLALILFMLSPDNEQRETAINEYNMYKNYLKNRTVVKICPDGTKVYSWDGKLWIFGNKYPDLEVTSTLDKIC